MIGNALRVIRTKLQSGQGSIQNAAVGEKEIGPRVRLMRIQKGWQQRDLARAAGVSIRTLGSLERGDVRTQWATLDAIAKALGTTIELLMQNPAPIAETDSRLRDLTDESLHNARKLLLSDLWVRLLVDEILSGKISRATVELSKRIARLPEDKRAAVVTAVELAESQPEPVAPKRKATKTKEHAS